MPTTIDSSVAKPKSQQRLTRRRIPLSCVACRVRKLKCNREKPCQNCIARGEGNTNKCIYAEKIEKKHSPQSNPRSDAEDMRKRLNRLESSILSMMSKDTGGKEEQLKKNPVTEEQGATVAEPPATHQAIGQIITHDTRSTHWDAILNEIEGLKDAWSEENDKIEYYDGFESLTTKAHRPSILTGLNPPPDRLTIMASLPPREASDRLIHQFFDSYNPAIPARYLVHKATFLKQYQQHWADPSKTKIIWIGLLYAMITISMMSYKMSKKVPPEYQGTAPAIAELYRVRTAQCLMIADLTKPVDFMIETLSMHSFAEYVEERDGDMGTSILSGTIMRLALQQGYHRDPSHHPNITVFQGEMRRRIWSAVNQHELLFSVQMGLPKALKYAEADTQSPRNVHEEELYEEMTELPPPRPLNEDTEVSYQVVKYQIMRAYGRVVEHLHIIETQPYEEVLKLDKALHDSRELIPPHLHLGTLEEMKHDAPSRVVEKYILQLFYHKAICVLHRKYWNGLLLETESKSWKYSRKNCVTSAVALLTHQATMHQASGSGGCMSPLVWYHFSITNHDFLLAAMVLCLDLMTELQKIIDTGLPSQCPIAQQEKLNTIEKSLDIWTEIIDDCRDAKRAVKILTSVLSKIAAKTKERDSKINSAKAGPLPAFTANNTGEELRQNTYFTDCIGLGMPKNGLQSQSSNSQTQSLNSQTQSSPESDAQMQDNFFDAMASDPNISMTGDFNWDVWDQFMTGQAQVNNQYDFQELSCDSYPYQMDQSDDIMLSMNLAVPWEYASNDQYIS